MNPHAWTCCNPCDRTSIVLYPTGLRSPHCCRPPNFFKYTSLGAVLAFGNTIRDSNPPSSMWFFALRIWSIVQPKCTSLIEIFPLSLLLSGFAEILLNSSSSSLISMLELQIYKFKYIMTLFLHLSDHHTSLTHSLTRALCNKQTVSHNMI